MNKQILLLLLVFTITLDQSFAIAPYSQFIDPHPTQGNQFGHTVLPLSTGKVVVTSPYDDFNGESSGAVYLFDGSTGALISELHGSQPNDRAGYGGVTALGNGDFVVRSPDWHNGNVKGAGAVTWGNGTSGINGLISATNSLVGSSEYDKVGYYNTSVIPLMTNGNYVVLSYDWKNGTQSGSGAVTWGSSNTGIIGVIGPTNSLVGTTGAILNGGAYDCVTALPNGNYLVRSSIGVTWASGTTGITGTVSPTNSLVGNTTADEIGGGGVKILPNSNYVVCSPKWQNGTAAKAGAVTWGSGTTGIAGLVSATNSLVGAKANDQIGYDGVTVLKNGNYIVRSSQWANASVSHAGAVTWGSKTFGVKGVVNSANSLVGGESFDTIGADEPLALSNGNYVTQGFRSVTWGNGITGVVGVVSTANSLYGHHNESLDSSLIELTNGNYVVASRAYNWYRGAVTWGSGTSGVRGNISTSNSLVGSTDGDNVGADSASGGNLRGVIPLSNGNYVIRSEQWDNGPILSAGAVTWGNGTSGTTGLISSSNSLIGGAESDSIGSFGVDALPNGNYVIYSPYWNSGAESNAGAVTWGNGTTGISGLVTSNNSLIGGTAGDRIGSVPVAILSNGNYVVCSPDWRSGSLTDVGAVTWCNAATGRTGVVNASNSLVGSSASDNIGESYLPYDTFGYSPIIPLSNGNYLVYSPSWDNGILEGAGAVTWGSGETGISGVISADNSLVGSSEYDAVGSTYSYVGVKLLKNGNYVVCSPSWDNGPVADAGAITWGSGSTGVRGVITPTNSLVGRKNGDKLGFQSSTTYLGLYTLNNGNYVVRSEEFKNGDIWEVGAITWGNGSIGTIGEVTSENSAVGISPYFPPYGGLTDIVPDNVNNYFYGVFSNAGIIRVGSQSDGFSDAGHPSIYLFTDSSALTFGSASPVDFGLSPVGVSAAKKITICNTGSSTLTLGSITIDGVNAADYSVSQPATSSLAPSASVTIVVTALPASLGVKTAAIHLFSNDVSKSQFNINLTANGIDSNKSVANAIDQLGAATAVGGYVPWYWQSAISHDGVDALRSGAITDSQNSTFSVVVSGPAIASFWWKVSSQTGKDYLRFSIDGVEQAGKISGTVDWQQVNSTLSSGNHTLLWSYAKDSSGSSGSDCGWVDQLVVTTGPEIAVEQPLLTDLTDGGTSNLGSSAVGSSSAVTTYTIRNKGTSDLTGLLISKDGSNSGDFLVGSPVVSSLPPGATTTFAVTFMPSALGTRSATLHIASNDVDENPFDINLSGNGTDPNQTVAGAIDQPGAAITAGGQLPWVWQATTTHDGSDAAKSGTITHSQSSTFSLSATGPANVSFWWKVSSESGWDYLRFSIDGVEQAGKISGTVDWQQVNSTLTSGNHTLLWSYAKDSSASSGSDCGWVDEVVFTSASSQAFNTAMTSAGLTGTNALPTATPYNDGVKNLLKYAFNMNLSGADTRGLVPGTGTLGLPSITSVSSGATTTLRVEFIRRIGSGLVYTPKRSSDLSETSWVALSDVPTVEDIDTNWQRVIYEEPLTTASTPKCFGVVEVTLP